MELANTLHRGSRKVIEGLQRPEHLAYWLAVHADHLPVPAAEAGEDLLERVLELRGQVREALLARADGKRPPPPVLEGLNRAAATAPSHVELRWPWEGQPVLVRHSPSPADGLVTAIAEATLRLLAETGLRPLRRCLGPGCIGVFVIDEPRRRYCAPPCSTRARAARHHARHTQARPPAR